MTQIIDGKKISAEIKDELKQEVAAMKAEGKEIALAVIQVGEDPASSVYVRIRNLATEIFRSAWRKTSILYLMIRRSLAVRRILILRSAKSM